MAELSNGWWQWAMHFSDQKSPLNDRSGARCAAGQRGPVWFLAGGYGSSKIHRVCTVPPDKAIFFPLINMAAWPEKGDRTYTCDQAKADAARNNETASGLFAELDGVAIQELRQYRVSSEKCFNVFAQMPSAKRPYNAYPAASDGYWLLLKPLSKGHHVLKFGGRYNQNDSAYGQMVQDIEYELLVQ